MNKSETPADLKWNTTPIPHASLCHPDSRIITYNIVPYGPEGQAEDAVNAYILRPHPSIYDYWIDARGGTHAPGKFTFKGFYWAWYRKF